MNQPTNNVKIYDPVWKCIYCGHVHTKAEPCGKEHIIPLSLGGPLVLPRACCSACSRNTRAFERTCARDMFGAYRLAGNLPTRHLDQRPRTLKIHVHSGPDTKREEHWLSLAEYPIISAVVPELEVAGILKGAPSTEVFQVNPKIVNLVRDTEARKKLEREGKQFEVSRTLKMTDFAKLLAKVAHSYAVAELGLGAFHSFLPPLILGETLNLPDFVGGVAPSTPNYNWFLGEPGTSVKSLIEHYLNLEIVCAADLTPYLTVVIQLLQSFAPKYRVVVAKA